MTPRMAGDRLIVHTKWPEAANAVYIGRPSILGNPFHLANPHDNAARARVIAQYSEWFHRRIDTSPQFRAAVIALRGKTLACWCPTRQDPWRACHGDVIIRWLEDNPNS